jgi:predicted ArsR family transcriptional regulator
MASNSHTKEDPERRQELAQIHSRYVKQQIAILSGLREHFGSGVMEVVERAHAEHALRPYLTIAHEKNMGAIDDLIGLVWEPLRAHGYEFEVERSERGVQIKCTACPLAALYRQTGGAEWGYRLYCAIDGLLVEQFNGRIGFRRTRTLMEGDECCDHFYYNKE